MKIMTDQQANALRDEGKIVLRVSDSEGYYCVFLISVLTTAALIFLLHVEPPTTWRDYLYFAVIILLGYGPALFLFIATRRSYVLLDRRGITVHRVFSKKYLRWKDVQFVGAVRGDGGYSTIVSAIPLPDGETVEGEYRVVSTRAQFRLRADPQTIFIPDSTADHWTPEIIEVWENYRRQSISPTVEDFYNFPRKPRQ